METKFSTLTTILAVCLIVLTAMIVLTINSDKNATHTIYQGLLMLLCLATFTASVIFSESATKKA
jgi:predicted Na+-dependent transporter